MAEQPTLIGVITSDIGGYYWGAMISGIHQVARSAGVQVLVVQQALRDQHAPFLGSARVAGWVLIHPLEEDRANLATLCKGAAPVVIVPVPLEQLPCTLVQVDNRGGMRAAVLHLIDHGHRRIAYVDHGPYAWSEQRYQGYCDALNERGIPHDPALVMAMESSQLDSAEIHQERGAHAAHAILEQGLPCTALAAGTDNCALVAMRVFQAAGYRIPNDLAVTGFDDMVDAQYADPPLTTVRSQFDVIGRVAAEQLLLEMHSDRAAPSQLISVPATILHRRSCGCTALDELLSNKGNPHSSSTNWQTRLTQQLVELVLYPLPLDPAILPTQIWPGAGMLVAAIDSALRGRPTDSAGIELAWQQAVAQTENLEVLHAAMTLLEDAADQRLAVLTDTTSRPDMIILLRRMRLELMRARLAHEGAPKQELSDQIRTNYAVSMALLGGSQGAAQALGWLEHTPATWACLGLWGEKQAGGAAALMIVGEYLGDATAASTLGQHISATAFPSLCQLPARLQHDQSLIMLCPIRTPLREWGILALRGWRGEALTTGTGNLAIQAALLGATLDRNTVLSTLTEQQVTLHAAFDREQILSQTIRELGCPVIPMLPGMLLVPLIGAIDSQRAQQIIGAVLEAISKQRAQTVFLDITGVSIVDTQVASSLIQTAQAATLLGAQVVMVGIRPEIAQSIVGLGIDLSHLKMFSDLAGAMRVLQQRRA